MRINAPNVIIIETTAVVFTPSETGVIILVGSKLFEGDEVEGENVVEGFSLGFIEGLKLGEIEGKNVVEGNSEERTVGIFDG
mmetsp:Transcript_913/g.1121  ORF Transcript_913/g.1121 Transcript_913/m.1121 type:complete len:82 (+) Transcript_913:353-598(+)